MTTALAACSGVLAAVVTVLAYRTIRSARLLAGAAAVRERLEAQVGLLEDEVTASALLATALTEVSEGVVVCDRHGTVTLRNARAVGLAGNRSSEALAEQTIEQVLAAALTGTPKSDALELFGPPRRILVISARPLHDGDELLGAVALVEDVTDRRRLEEMRRDFVANLSHELKTPVGAVGLLAETLADEDDVEVAKRLAARIQTEAWRVGQIIEDLLDLSRIEAEQLEVPEVLKVAHIVGEAVSRLQPAAEQRAIAITVAVDDVLAVIGDRRQLVSAVHNLVDNAVKYSNQGSVVAVAAGARDGRLELTVRDEGIGIPARDLERIFERFYRVDRARARETGGTGLGLAIVRHVARNHGGEVRVESQEGRGSTFALSLPLAPPNVTSIPRAG